MKQDTKTPDVSVGNKSSKTKVHNLKNSHKIVVGILISLIFLTSSAFAYNLAVINNPNKIWEESLNNTSKLLDEIDATLKINSPNSGTVNGEFSSTSPVDIQGTIDGSWSENNSKYRVDANIAGINTTSNILVFGSDIPEDTEVYFKISGLDKVTPLLQLVQPELYSTLSTVNDTWYLLDKSNVGTSEIEEKQTKEPNIENISEIKNKIEGVIGKSIASLEADNSLVAVNPVGREEHNGYSAYKYDLTIQKQQLIKRLKSIKSELSEGQINYLQNLAQLNTDENLDLDKLIAEIENTDEDIIYAQAWVDIDQKLIRSVGYSLPSDDIDSTRYIEFNIGYDEGDGYASSIVIVAKPSENSEDSLNLLITSSINKNKTLYEFGLSISGVRNGEPILTDINLNLNSTDVEVDEEKPTEYKNATELLEQILQLEALKPNS